MNPETLREDLLKQWPTITRMFGIKPFECDLLTMEEWQVYLAAVERKQEADAAQQREYERQLAQIEQAGFGRR